MPYMSYNSNIDDDDGSDIEIIGTSLLANQMTHEGISIDILKCGFCALPIEEFSLHQRQQHYDKHFRGSSSKSILPTASPPANRKVSFTKIFHIKGKGSGAQESDVFWYSSQSVNPPPNYTPGLIPLLKKALWTSHSAGSTRRAVLCYSRTVHIRHVHWDWTWGCGYRNFLMACTALMDQTAQPVYTRLLAEPLSPSVRNLQAWIEAAWNAGFDKQGAKELKKLAGTDKWIGTADLWVAFTYRGIPAELVDFDLKHQARGAEIVIDWIIDYFSSKLEPAKPANVHDALRGASPIIVTERMPLILQHDGHSRTIIGYEVAKNGKVTLLMFDPSTEPDKDTRKNALSLWSHSSSPRRSCSQQDRGIIRKRDEDNSPSRPIAKRARSVEGVIDINDSEDDVLIIEDPPVSTSRKPPETAVLSNLDSRKLLGKFRLGAEKLGKKAYQILYFPMTEPLTDEQRTRSKTVLSTRIC